MMNFREIFNISYSYIGIIIIGVILLLLFLLDGKGSIKIIGGSFFVAGVLLFLIYFFGNMIVGSFSYKFFVEIISDNFFNGIVIASVISVLFGGIGIGVYKYIK